MIKFLCLAILTFAMSARAAPNCEGSLLGTSFIRLIEMSLADKQLSPENIKGLALSKTPVNPMEGKVATSANAALSLGFKKVLEDPNLKKTWPSIRGRLRELLTQLGADSKISETAKNRVAKVLSPKLVQSIRFRHPPISFPRLQALPNGKFLAAAITVRDSQSDLTAQFAEIYRPSATKTEAVLLGNNFFQPTYNSLANIGEGASAPVLFLDPKSRNLMLASSKSLTEWQEISLESYVNRDLELSSRIFSTSPNCYLAILSARNSVPAFILRFCENTKGKGPTYSVSPLETIADQGSLSNFQIVENGDLYLAVTRIEKNGERFRIFLAPRGGQPVKVFEDFNGTISTDDSFFVAEDRTIYLARSRDGTLLVEKLNRRKGSSAFISEPLWGVATIKDGLASHRWVETKDGRVLFASSVIRSPSRVIILTSDVNSKTVQAFEVGELLELLNWARFEDEVYKIPYIDESSSLRFISVAGCEESVRFEHLASEIEGVKIEYDLNGQPHIAVWADKHLSIYSLLNEVEP